MRSNSFVPEATLKRPKQTNKQTKSLNAGLTKYTNILQKAKALFSIKLMKNTVNKS